MSNAIVIERARVQFKRMQNDSLDSRCTSDRQSATVASISRSCAEKSATNFCILPSSSSAGAAAQCTRQRTECSEERWGQ
jgi:hypothetical protein